MYAVAHGRPALPKLSADIINLIDMCMHKRETYILCSVKSNKKQEAAFSFEGWRITLRSQASLSAWARMARKAGPRRTPQARSSELEEKNSWPRKVCGRGPGPRIDGWKENSKARVRLQRARTWD